MAPKPNITDEQRTQYDDVMNKLQASGCLQPGKGKGQQADKEPAKEKKKPGRPKKAAPEDPAEEKPAKKAKKNGAEEKAQVESATAKGKPKSAAKSKKTQDAEPAPADAKPKKKTRAADDPETAPTDAKPKKKTQAADPETAPGTAAKPAKKAKTDKTNTGKEKQGATCGKKDTKKGKKVETEEEKIEEFYDKELGIMVSWKNYPAVVKAVLKAHPHETEEGVKLGLTETLGPCPFDLCGSEAHPGPVLQDPTLEEPEEEAQEEDEDLDGDAFEEEQEEEDTEQQEAGEEEDKATKILPGKESNKEKPHVVISLHSLFCRVRFFSL